MPTHVYRQGKPVGTRIEPDATRVWPGEPLLQGTHVVRPGGAPDPHEQGILEGAGRPAGSQEKEAQRP